MAFKLLCRTGNIFLANMQRSKFKWLHTNAHSRKWFYSGNRKKSAFALNTIQENKVYLEQKFPSVVNVYRSFINGTREFYKEFRLFLQLVRVMKLEQNGIRSLNLKQLELYDRMPSDLCKIAPVLVLSVLPLANYLMFPLLYMYPRQLLTSHFWSQEQKRIFIPQIMERRLTPLRPLYSMLQCRFDDDEDTSFSDWMDLIGRAESNEQILVDDIVRYKPLFSYEPFNLKILSDQHVRCLLQLHDLHKGWFRNARLSRKALMYKAMDNRVLVEGGIPKLSLEVLRKACLIRGLNVAGRSRNFLHAWLEKWIAISNEVDKRSVSLLLHAPLLITVTKKEELEVQMDEDSDVALLGKAN